MFQQRLLQKIIDASRLWSEGREGSHRFILSPEIYQLDRDELRELNSFGPSLHSVMAGFAKIAEFSEDQRQAKGSVWDVIRKVIRIGIPRTHRRVQHLSLPPVNYPLAFKVDFLRSGGSFRALELDGVNTHGFGYTVLLNQFRAVLPLGLGLRLPGVASTIASYLHANFPDRPLFIFISGNSRFYEQYYRIFAQELMRLGISAVVAGEWMPGHERLLPENAVALQFPIFRNDSPLQTIFEERYVAEKLPFLIPPKTYMGSKSVFALLKNSNGDEKLEEVINRFVDAAALETFREFLPKTYIVAPGITQVTQESLAQSSWVVKQAISSGTKGVSFTDSKNLTVAAFEKEPSGLISLQEELEQDRFKFRYFDPDGNLATDSWFARFTAHYHFDTLAELDVTARKDKMVHGAKDCLMFGSIVLP